MFEGIDKLLESVGSGNIVNSLIFLALDLFIVFVLINGILTWRDNKRWAPLRRDVYSQAHLLVFLIFHAARSALRKDKESELNNESIHTMLHFIQEAKQTNSKLSKRLALYGSGLGEKMLPQMAVINEECEDFIKYLEFSILSFSPEYAKKNCYFYNSFKMKSLEEAVGALKQMKSNHSKNVANQRITKDKGFDFEWVSSYFSALAKLDPRVVLSKDDINSEFAQEVVVLGTSELSEIASSPEVQKMTIRTLRSF
ncbi:hypothetical protein [Marinimicrobium agarilyticum]|uniref:hypothetical protein n=1 Tax=Marinimicrobium agarilyticum TaxID=306546 RepID=UPI00048A1C94|nr:hypothetical protein [Marinimicrobium agarilyticum]